MKLSKSLLKLTSTPLLVLTASLGILQAQQVDVPEIKHNTAGCSIDWRSKDGRSYFLQYSSDMENWQFMPSIRSGDGSMLSTGFQCNSPEFFLRLNWTDLPDGGDVESQDFDGDGLSNLFEVSQAQEKQTNPFLSDSDSDGLHDGVEFMLNLNPLLQDTDGNGTPDSEEDSDDDGVSNVIEQNSGSNPNHRGDLGIPSTVELDEVRYEYQFGRLSTDARSFHLATRDKEKFPPGLPFSYRIRNSASTPSSALTGFTETSEQKLLLSGSVVAGAESQTNRSGQITFRPVAPPSSGYQYISSPASIEFIQTQVLDTLESEFNEWRILGDTSLANSFGYQTNHPRQIALTPVNGFSRSQNVSSYYQASKFRLSRATAESTAVEQHFIEVIEESPGFTTIEGERQDVTSEVKSFTLTIPAGGTTSSSYTVQAPLKNEVETHSRIFPIKIEVRNDAAGRWETAEELKIAKWEDAWVGGSFRENFIDAPGLADADRFRIRIDGASLPEEQRKFYISSKGSSAAEYNDNPTEVILGPDVNPFTRKSKGFVSQPIILVADTTDNKFNNNNDSNDQTHIVALGSDVEFRIGEPTGELVASLPVKKEKSLHIAVKLLWQGGSGPSQDALDNISDDLKVAKEIYGQTGIDLSFTVTAHQVELAGVDLSDGLRLDRTLSRGVLEAEGEAVLNSFATPNDTTDVVALYIDGVLLSGASSSGVLSGIGIWDNNEVLPHLRRANGVYWNASVSEKYKGTLLVQSDRNTEATFAHELGHVLALPHINIEKMPENRKNDLYSFRNVMTGSETTYDRLPHKDSKRFSSFQELRMLKSQFVK